MDFMVINNFNTSTIPKCVVTDFGTVEAAKPKVAENPNLFGVNGAFRVLDGAYESYERTITFYVARQTDIATIVEKFKPEDNIVEFSYQANSFFYAEFVGATYKPHGMHGWRLEIKLVMQPFRYMKNPPTFTATSSTTITNMGNVYSEPIVEVEGSGDVLLTINGISMYLTVNRKVTIDCRHKKQNIYNADMAIQNTLRKRGGFFQLKTGHNGIVWTGNVRSVKIYPNWRFII